MRGESFEPETLISSQLTSVSALAKYTMASPDRFAVLVKMRSTLRMASSDLNSNAISLENPRDPVPER